MIAIVNIGPHDADDPTGWRTYEVRINHEVMPREHLKTKTEGFSQ